MIILCLFYSLIIFRWYLHLTMFSKTNLQMNQHIFNLNSDSSHDRQPVSPQTKVRGMPFQTANTFSTLKVPSYTSKINHLIEAEDELSLKSKVVRLMSATDNNFHFHDDAANVFNRYPHRDIVFIGIWGADTGEKAYFYDKILRLCGVDQEKYTESMIQGNDQYNMVFYERPFIKGNMRVFLIDCKGYTNENKLNKAEKVQLDLLMSLCQIIVLVQTPNDSSSDIIDVGFNHFNQSFKRLYVNKAKEGNEEYFPVNSISWPRSLFVLYSDKQSIKRHQDLSQKEEDLRNMFNDFNFSLLHSDWSINNRKSLQTYTTITNPLEELYLKNAQSVFLCIYHKLLPKNFNNLKCTGFTAPLMIMQLVNSLNSHNSIFIPKVLEKVRRNVYNQVYNRHALNYVLKLKEYIQEERAYSDQYLISAFQDIHEETMSEWDWNYGEIVVSTKQNDELYDHYEEKLEQYIDEKQRNVLMVNHKKSLEELENQNWIKPNQPTESHYKLVQLRSQYDQGAHHYDCKAEAVSVGNNLKVLFSQRNISYENNHQQNLEILRQKQLLFQRKKDELTRTKLYNTKKASQLQSQQQSEQEKLMNNQQEIAKEVEKYQQRITGLKEKRLRKSQEGEQQSLQLQQLMELTQNRYEELKQQLKASIMVRNKLIHENERAIIEKSKIMTSQLDDKRKLVQDTQKTIFESKVNFYRKHKIAQKRKVNDQKMIVRSKLK